MSEQVQVTADTGVVGGEGGAAGGGGPAPVKRRARKPVQRLVRLVIPVTDSPGVIRLKVGDEESVDYVVSEVPVDWPARGFRLSRVGGDTNEAAYHVLLEGEGGSCECKGYLRWGKCKHRDSFLMLQQRELL